MVGSRHEVPHVLPTRSHSLPFRRTSLLNPRRNLDPRRSWGSFHVFVFRNESVVKSNWRYSAVSNSVHNGGVGRVARGLNRIDLFLCQPGGFDGVFYNLWPWPLTPWLPRHSENNQATYYDQRWHCAVWVYVTWPLSPCYYASLC